MITALTHPLIDILISCPAELLTAYNLAPGSYGIVEKSEQDALIEVCRSLPQRSLIGGSAANSMAAACAVGVPTAVLGLMGDDPLGHQMHSLYQSRGITTPLALVQGERTGSCLSLITPDGERTMRTYHGVVRSMGPAHIDEHTISSSRWLLLEGYFLTASSHNTDALYHSIALAKKHGTKVAFSASAEFVISSRRDEIMQKVLPLSDLIFANQGEALLLTQTSDPLAALHHLAQRTPSVVITRGNQGAHGIFQGASWEVQASKPAGPVVDTTGAGDAFAGVYLAGLTLGHSPQTAAQGAAQIASLVVTQRGAQLPLETYTVFT